jgi:hypothetical protein
MNTKQNKLAASVSQFINYSYKGDGKYYQFEGRNSSRTLFGKVFDSKHRDAVIATYEQRNDAPRGGVNGTYCNVVFTPGFKAIAEKILSDKQAAEQARIDAKQAIEDNAKQAAGLIETIDGGTHQETCSRLSKVLGEKIEATVFFKAVHLIRNRK